MTTALRIGVIGCGAIAQIMHIPYICEYEQFELVALADSHWPTLDAVADRYHISTRYTDSHLLIARNDIDAVVITHSGSHRDTVMAALRAGKHVFVEKPITWNAREAEELLAYAMSSDRVVQVGYHKLYDPAFAYTKNEVEQMADLAYVRVTVLHPANDLGLSPHRIRRGDGRIYEGHVDIALWDNFVQSQLEDCAGDTLGPLVDEALQDRQTDTRLRIGYGLTVSSIIHQIYMIYEFLGEPTRIVNAEIWRQGMSLQTLIEYKDGLRCSLDWHYLPYLKDYREEYAFYGNSSRVILQFPSPYLRNHPSPVTVHGGNGELAWEKHINVSFSEAFANQLLDFYNNVQQKKTPLASLPKAVMHMRFIQQWIEAVR